MAPASWDAVIAELVFKRDVHRAWDVAPLVRVAAVRFSQLPTHVQDRQRFIGGQASGQFGCGDQYLVAAHHIDGAT